MKQRENKSDVGYATLAAPQGVCEVLNMVVYHFSTSATEPEWSDENIVLPPVTFGSN